MRSSTTGRAGVSPSTGPRRLVALITSPISFFEERVRLAPSWWLAAGGPLGCVVLGVASQWILSEEIAEPMQAVTASIGIPSALVTSMRRMGALGSAFFYVSTWLTISAFTASVDILLRDSKNLTRILELNGLAFYSQWPWLLATLALALTFEPPDVVAAGAGASTVLDDVRRFKDALEADATLTLIRRMHVGFTAWLYCLFGAAYHVASGIDVRMAMTLSAAMYAVFHLLGWML